jgi:hypothetical protein
MELFGCMRVHCVVNGMYLFYQFAFFMLFVCGGQALSVCRHHGGPIAGVGASLCRTLGALAWREGRVGAALYWLLEGHDGARAGAAVKELVQAVEAALQVRRCHENN